MDSKLVISITAIAIALAEKIKNDDELELFASVLALLSCTLDTIITQRELCANKPEFSEVPPII
jgi:hypothetical protein